MYTKQVRREYATVGSSIPLVILHGVFYIFGQEEWRKCLLQVVGGHRLIPLGVGIPRPRRALARKRGKTEISNEGDGRNPDDNIPRIIVARPRAVPIPLPFIAFCPVRLNLRKRKR